MIKLLMKQYAQWRMNREYCAVKREAAQWYAQALKMTEEGLWLQRTYPNLPDGLKLIEESMWMRSYARALWKSAKRTTI